MTFAGGGFELRPIENGDPALVVANDAAALEPGSAVRVGHEQACFDRVGRRNLRIVIPGRALNT